MQLSFEEIYSAYSSRIYRLCMGYVNDAEQAKDIVQDTFISVWNNLAKFRNESSVGTWIFRIATNNCLRHIEKEKKRPVNDIPLHLEDKTEAAPDEKIRFLYKCIASLEETDRIIILLYMEDLPQAEIASVMGLTEGNIRVKIHRIKEKLTHKFLKHEQL